MDTGGTFTDVVDEQGVIDKVPSTPADPPRAVRRGLGSRAVAVLAHGTTVATNALLQRRGARVALITDHGFADVIEIARQDRPALYDLWADRPVPLVRREDRIQVADSGPAEDAVAIPAGIHSVAMCLLHADVDPDRERRIAANLRFRGYDVSASHEVSPEFREYERTVTTVLNAYLRPPCRAYLQALAGLAPQPLVLTSAGGLIPAAEASELPVALLLSGPAGGVGAGAAAALDAGFADAVTFDMGGTSTDVCLVLGGRPEPATLRMVAGLPVRMPAVDVLSIGAGGGSIATLDRGGALTVGPRSAGAVPGPASYGRGGLEPTVTDADVVAGRLEGVELPGIGVLDAAAARAALDRAGVTAGGVLAVVDSAMSQAVRAVSVQRGVDPRGLVLVAFGGAGPLHACAVAADLGMAGVIVPPRAGVLSAVGVLGAAIRANRVRSWPTPRDHHGLGAALAALGEETARAAGDGATVATSVDCRYAGQSHELTVASVADFEAAHARLNGFALPGVPVEVVALRAQASIPSPVSATGLPAPSTSRRGPVVGPAVIAEPDCTVWVPEDWVAAVTASGAWLIQGRRRPR